MKKLDFIYFDAGGGHRSAANALKQVIEDQQRPWEVRLFNLQEALQPLDVFYKVSGLRLEDCYNLMLKKGWTLGSGILTAGMHFVIRFYHRQQVELLTKIWAERRPDMVVSLVPNFASAINQSLHAACPNVPLVTVLTDISDFPPHFWIEPDPQYYICGSDKAVEQARSFRHPPEHIFRTSGMILNPRFYKPVEVDRAEERSRLGLDPHRCTALVLFGGEGSAKMLDIARCLDSSDLDLQLILICGRNDKLARKLKDLPHRKPVFVEGFTCEIPYYMHLADFFIGKPGPGSISEALAMKLPVIVERNAWTLPQERYNSVWVTEREVGVVVRSFHREITAAARKLLAAENYQRYRTHAAAQNNRAVFEIPDILEQILCGA